LPASCAAANIGLFDDLVIAQEELRPQIRRVDAAIVACTMIKVKPM
jgi:hypothetical protein